MRTLLLAAVVALATAAAHAQGLGGMLNQAKARATSAVAPALPANGEDPPTPPT